jgi:ADP-ribosylglycohydrolase
MEETILTRVEKAPTVSNHVLRRNGRPVKMATPVTHASKKSQKRAPIVAMAILLAITAFGLKLGV